MIYLVCAMYGEAVPWIERFGLKKQTTFHRVQVFANEQIMCIITGVGSMAAATALTEVLTTQQIQGKFSAADILLNIGVCGCKDKEVPCGTTYLCHSIQDGATGRIYYPDILYKHPFQEETLYSATKPFSTSEIQSQPCRLIDMEGAGVYQSGIRFFETHRMFFVKIVSDYGVQSSVQDGTAIGQDVRTLVAQHVDTLVQWLEPWLTDDGETQIFTPEQEAELQTLCRSLKASVTMEQEIRQMMTWCRLNGNDGVAQFYAFLQAQGIEAIQSKREGALQLARFKQQLF